MDSRIVKYYLLCTIRNGVKRHIINEVPSTAISVVLTKKEIALYLRSTDGNYVARDIVIGGTEPCRGVVIVI